MAELVRAVGEKPTIGGVATRSRNVFTNSGSWNWLADTFTEMDTPGQPAATRLL